MGAPITKLTIRGFKSIRELNSFELKNLNVIIGANGAGKSNFVEFFRVLAAMMKKNGLKEYIAQTADAYLFGGPKSTTSIISSLYYGEFFYTFLLVPTEDGDLYCAEDGIKEVDSSYIVKNIHVDYHSSFASLVRDARYLDIGQNAKAVFDAITSIQVYHFHDTTKEAGMRRLQDQAHNERLFEDGSNIAPFLMRLRDEHSREYQDIRNVVRLVMPFFDDFILKSDQNENVRLNWRQKGLNDYPMRPSQLSDGSIRFICLAAALLQPKPPSTIIIDEPELGLHPGAIALLAEMIKTAAQSTQVIVATQSPTLIDDFGIEDIVVVNRKDGASTFARLDEKDFAVWLEEYSVGELWQKNLIAGGTVYE